MKMSYTDMINAVRNTLLGELETLANNLDGVC